MEIRPVEKLMLVMLSEIYEKLGCDGVDPGFVREAIYGGHDWAFEWQYPGIFDAKAIDYSVVKEVTDILDTWSFLEEAGNEQFPGFDTNRESSHASVAAMMTEQMGRFDRFAGRTGHGVLGLDGYRRMAAKFKTIRPTLGGRNPIVLTPNEVKELLDERIHPDNR